MAPGTKAVDFVILVGLAVSGLLSAIAGGADQGDKRQWFFAAAIVLGAAVLLGVLYFLVWPLLEAAERFRLRKLAQIADRPPPESLRPAPKSPPRAAPIQGTLEITNASYGANGIGTDVTDFLRGRIVENQLHVPVDNGFFGVDPVPNIVKTLTVWYSIAGKPVKQPKYFTEGTFADLP